MLHRLDDPAQLKFTREPTNAPLDWTNAEEFATLREALEAAVGRIAEGPWIRSGGETIKPAEVDDLWKEAFRSRSD